MAENVKAASQPKISISSSSDKSKVNNVIGERTSTDTLTLNGAVSCNTTTTTTTAAVTITASRSSSKKQCSSFQITSVVVGRANDAGDDSADDLDESHADDISDVIDNSSRITDNETPSYSEDTYSKEDVFYNVTTTGLCSAPVIPTSAQYGLAIVPQSQHIATTALNMNNNLNLINHNNSNNNNNNVADVSHSSVMETTATTKAQETRNDRFKVVKIESTEPFKRGRWMCMDYLDHSINAQQLQQQQQVPHYIPATEPQRPAMPQQQQLPPQQQPPSQQQQLNAQQQQAQSAPVAQANYYPPPNQQGQSISPRMSTNQYIPQAQYTYVQQQQPLINQVPITTSAVYNGNTSNTGYIATLQGQSYPNQIYPAAPSSSASSYGTSANGSSYVAQSYAGTSVSSTNNVPTQGQSYAGQTSSGTASTIQSFPNNQGQQNYSSSVQAQAQQQPYIPSTQYNYTSSTQAAYQHSNYVTMPSSPANVAQQPVYPSTATPQSELYPQTYSNSSQAYQTPNQQTYIQTQPIYPNPKYQTAAPAVAPVAVGAVAATKTYPVQNLHANTSVVYSNSRPSGGTTSSQSEVVVPAVSPVDTQNIAVAESSQNEQQNNDDILVTMQNVTTGIAALEETDAAAGNSAVAIDNKIEQAMDLVKSHLMFAVREEVEVLKEKIAELMDRINQLESENSILKAAATQETLATLTIPAATTSTNTPATTTVAAITQTSNISPVSAPPGGSA